ncbi:MAG: site-2 protease family protein [Eubacterium sp.]|nr:site-2 protease family protein [Eubacterium sp.]MDE6155946.1 site-2 protease family protein [Eubacterium sp.]MDE6766774.1 site-2 protease family protein [Eubacterium sp.]
MGRIGDMITMLREGSYLELTIMLCSTLFVVFCCMPMHELAHAYAAYKCGDDTAKLKGRISLNPFAHLDFLGTIMIFCFGIGYAKPVPVNPARLKHPRRDMALISLAGPASNLVMGFVWMCICFAIDSLQSSNEGIIAISTFFWYAASVNVTLAVFNLLPVPPLDGSKIYSAILPDKIYFKIMKYDRYIMIGFILLLFTGVLDGVIYFITNIMLSFISIIPRAIFG